MQMPGRDLSRACCSRSDPVREFLDESVPDAKPELARYARRDQGDNNEGRPFERPVSERGLDGVKAHGSILFVLRVNGIEKRVRLPPTADASGRPSGDAVLTRGVN